MPLKKSILICGVLGAMLSVARADTPEPAAADDGVNSLTLAKGKLLLDASVEINLSDGGVFKPFSISPDLWYGVNDDITVGLVHSAHGTTGFMGGVGTSLCLSGTSGFCSSVYPNVGIDVRYRLKPSGFSWAADGGLYILNTSDPFLFAVKLGVVGRWQSGKLAIEGAPNLFIGLTERDRGTKETLNIPITGLYTVAPKIALILQTGFALPLEAIGDGYAIPLSLGANYAVNDNFNASLALSFPALISAANGGLDFRTITLGGTYAF